MVDDQFETYTVGVLRTLKENHEKWVSSALTEEKQIPPVRIKRIKENIPTYLVRISSGQDLFNLLSGSMAASFSYDDPQAETEVDLLSGFFQEVQDWMDLAGDLDAGRRVEAAFRIGSLIRNLEDAGFWLFACKEVQRMEGGIAPPSAWPVVTLRALRETNTDIIKMDLSDQQQQQQCTK